MPDTEYRSFVGEIRNLQKKNDFLFDVTLKLLNNAPNRNNWQFTDMSGNKDQFAGKPLLVAYEFGRVGSGHNSTKAIGKNGEEYLSYMGSTDERIIGSMSDDPNDIWVETDAEGIEWIYGRGTIWKWYAREAVEKIERDTANGRPMSISIEALVNEFRMDGEIEVELEWSPLGVTLLGDGVRPAVAGAHIKSLSEECGFEYLKLRAASFIDEGIEGNKEEPQPDIINNKPQNKSNVKETKTLKAYSKKQLAALAPKFEGYTVLAAGQDDNGIHVCLLTADGMTAVYTMESAEDTIVPEKVVKVNSQAGFTFGEESILVDCSDMTDALSADLIKANSRIATLEADLATANGTISTMQEVERKRRIAAAKAKAVSVLNGFNATSAEKIDEVCLNSINEKIDAGEYNGCVDKEGCWTGESVVERDVLAECGRKQMEINAKACAARNTQYVYDSSYGVHREDGASDVEAFLASYGKK